MHRVQGKCIIIRGKSSLNYIDLFSVLTVANCITFVFLGFSPHSVDLEKFVIQVQYFMFLEDMKIKHAFYLKMRGKNALGKYKKTTLKNILLS